MISKSQSEELLKNLPPNWADDVLALLKKRRVKTRFNKPYSKSMLRQVIYGYKENKAIEKAILDVFEKIKIDTKNLTKRKEVLLSA